MKEFNTKTLDELRKDIKAVLRVVEDLHDIRLNDFMESDLPGYLERHKIKYKIILADKSKYIPQNSIAFFFPFD